MVPTSCAPFSAGEHSAACLESDELLALPSAFCVQPCFGVCTPNFCVTNVFLGLTWLRTTSFCNLGSIAGVAAAYFL